MQRKPKPARLLYGVSSVGLGHAKRSIAIARELSGFEVTWVAAEPVLSYLRLMGEKNILDASRSMYSMADAMEGEATQGKISDMSRVARASSRIAKGNYFKLKSHLKEFDVLVQDEFAETMFSRLWDKEAVLPPKKVVITDYLRFETSSINPLNRLVLFYANRLLSRAFLSSDLRVFADDLDALPDDSRLRRFAKENFVITGPLVGEKPVETKEELRRRFLPPYHKDNVIVFSIGGTKIGSQLIDFAINNCAEIEKELDATIVILTGSINRNVTSGIALLVPLTTDSMSYFKLANCIVAQAGATTLNEVASLDVPCVCIPIGNHWEQQANALRFKEKFGFGVLQYDSLGKENLIQAIKSAMASRKPFQESHDSKPERKVAQLIEDLVKI